MKRLLAVVEGEGDVDAVPSLVTRALRRIERFDWVVAERETFVVGGLPQFRARIEAHVESLRRHRVDAAIVLLDLDDGCPMVEGPALATELRRYKLQFPVAVVLAHREYEAWFLASLPSIAPSVDAFPDDARYEGDPEGPRNCKARLDALMPYGRTYSPTLDQRRFTRLVDLDLAAERSRSFRRLLNAVDEVTSSTGPIVTPVRR